MAQERVMKNSIRIFVYLCVMVLLSACVLKQDNLDINSYSLDFKSNKSYFVNSSKSIYIEVPSVNKSFNGYSIFYTTKPYLFEEYALNRWINLPSYMIQSNLVQSIQNSNLFKTVLEEKSKIKFDYELKTNVVNLYHSFESDKSYAIVKVRFDLVSNDEVIKTYSYDKKILCETNNAYSFVIATNKAFEEVVKDLSLQLSQIK
jgi:cholesterol transport system auxiliary component